MGSLGMAATMYGSRLAGLGERLAHSRPSRVILLAAVIVVLSGVDLYLTLMYLTLTGMPEANPLARVLIQTGTPNTLIAWKLGTVALCVWILYMTRATRTGELGAWIGMAVLIALTVHWGAYARQGHLIAELAQQIDPAIATDNDSRWVQFDTTSTARAE